MSSSVGWLGDVLNASERLQQLAKTDSIWIVNLVDVDVKDIRLDWPTVMTIFSNSLSVAAFIHRASGSMLESTGSHGRGVKQRDEK